MGLTQAAWQTEQLLSDFEVNVENVYLTYAPSSVPSVRPTTSLPTAAPSITGLVSVIELSTVVTESLTISELDNIQQQSADTYGVDLEDVTVEVVYQTTGSMAIEIGNDVS